jgi:hypothetical protein
MAQNPRAESISPRLVTALDRTWSAIRARHPDVPEVVIALGAGTDRRTGIPRYGHFSAGRWQRSDGRLPELFIGGEGLERGAVPVLGTLLHEGAHGIAAARGIQDTSRQGRYHNARFRDLAAEVGVNVAKVRSLGWSETSVPDATANAYRAEVRRLEAAIVAFRRADHGGGRGGRTNSNNGVAARCDCGRRIRVAETVLELGPITCGVCGGDFEAAEATDSPI